jgi:hypothetical protein
MVRSKVCEIRLWQLDYNAEGSIPDVLIGVPRGGRPNPIKQFQDHLDQELAGDLTGTKRSPSPHPRGMDLDAEHRFA